MARPGPDLGADALVGWADGRLVFGPGTGEGERLALLLERDHPGRVRAVDQRVDPGVGEVAHEIVDREHEAGRTGHVIDGTTTGYTYRRRIRMYADICAYCGYTTR